MVFMAQHRLHIRWLRRLGTHSEKPSKLGLCLASLELACCDFTGALPRAPDRSEMTSDKRVCETCPLARFTDTFVKVGCCASGSPSRAICHIAPPLNPKRSEKRQACLSFERSAGVCVANPPHSKTKYRCLLNRWEIGVRTDLPSQTNEPCSA